MPTTLGVIGLGTMGRPIAENLLRAGFPVTAYDVRQEAVKPLVAQGAEPADAPAEVAARSEVILLVVPDQKAVRAVLFGENGAAAVAVPGGVVMDMTTSDPASTPRIAARLRKSGIEYLDAAMTGGVTGARAARLLLMVGASQELFQRCLPIFRAISKRAIHVGGVGQGHLVKLLHNHVSHAVYAATCEAVALGEMLGLSAADMIEVFNEGNARSYSTEFRFPKFILSGTYDMGATFDIVAKDMALVRKLGPRAKLRLPFNGATYACWKHAVDTGRGQEDWATAVKMMKQYLRAGAGGREPVKRRVIGVGGQDEQ